MVFVFDVECFPNFFSVVLWSIDESVKKTLYIYKDHNDIEEIESIFWDKSNWFVGYNNSNYDDIMIDELLNGFNETDTTDEITQHLFELSNDIINNNKKFYDVFIPFKSFDLQRVGGLYKSLKLVAVNLKHERIQDLPKPFNEPVEDEEVTQILDYNNNDVSITFKLYHHLREEIKLRQKLSKKYGQNLMNYPDSGIANRILERDYEEFSGIPQVIFKDRKTIRDKVDFGEIISDKIYFENTNLAELLDNIKRTSAGKRDKIEFKAVIGNTRYDILKGGIHSNMPPKIYESNDKYLIIDFDCTSYYPISMINQNVIPEHIHRSFISLMKGYVNTRVKAKQSGDKVAADSLKIVVNSIYGKMGYENHWLYDIKAMYQVTLNCQLFLLMLIEWFESIGIQVFYANTDGITAMVSLDKMDELNSVCRQWEEYTGFNLESTNYKKCIIRDVNNYIWIPQEGKIKYKGAFDPFRYNQLSKGFDKPIVPLAVSNYFVKGIPIRETIENHDDILDFCMAQKPGEKFDIFFDYIDGSNLVTVPLQQTNRYYVCKKGGSIYKKEGDKKISLVAGESITLLNDITERHPSHYDVDYKYYIREANKIIDLFNNNQMELFK